MSDTQTVEGGIRQFEMSTRNVQRSKAAAPAQPSLAISPQRPEQHVLLVLPLLRAQQAARHNQHRLQEGSA